MTRSLAPTALLLGNFVIGTTILAPTGMLPELSAAFGVSIRDAGLLITFGAVVLCICSPLSAWLTSRLDRRVLLSGIMLVMVVANLASAFAPGYEAMMAIRLVMMAAAAPFTPQAAGTVGLIVAEEKRGSAIAYVFLGWSRAAAVGLPMVTVLASRYGWQAPFACITVLALVNLAMLLRLVPPRLFGEPVELKTWLALGRNALVGLLLLVTFLQMSGQFVVLTFMGPLLQRLAGAGSDAIAVVFALYGIFGFIGNVIATKMVDRLGGYRTSLIFVTSLLAGMSIWAFGAGGLVMMTVGVGFWGLGFASSNSMQQVRLVMAAPAMAGVLVSLNTSVLYIAQAFGSAVGGALFVRGRLHATGYAAVTLIVLALGAILLTRRLSEASGVSDR